MNDAMSSGDHLHGRPHIGANGVSWPPWKNGWKIKKRKHAKKSSFLNILRAIRAGRCRERRYADHIFIQIYFRINHFVVKFSKFSSPQAARGHWPPNQNHADPPDHRSGRARPEWRKFMMTCLRWTFGYTRLEIWRPLAVSTALAAFAAGRRAAVPRYRCPVACDRAVA